MNGEYIGSPSLAFLSLPLSVLVVSSLLYLSHSCSLSHSLAIPTPSHSFGLVRLIHFGFWSHILFDYTLQPTKKAPPLDTFPQIEPTTVETTDILRACHPPSSNGTSQSVPLRQYSADCYSMLTVTNPSCRPGSTTTFLAIGVASVLLLIAVGATIVRRFPFSFITHRG